MSVLGSGGLRYGPQPPPPGSADLPTIATDRYTYGPSGPGLIIWFRDGSRLAYPGIKSEDWDYVSGGVTIVQNEVEHLFPLDQVAYIRWQKS